MTTSDSRTVSTMRDGDANEDGWSPGAVVQDGESTNARVIVESGSADDDDNNNDEEEIELRQQQQQSRRRTVRAILSSDEESGGNDEVTATTTTKKRRRISVQQNEGCSSGDEAGTCAICFEAYTISGSHRIVCLKCGHLFGQSCIERWIRTERNAKCPQCKAKARLVDIRRLYARTVKAVDTTELENLKQANMAYRAENESLRLENERLKAKIANETEINAYKIENEQLLLENVQLKAKIASGEGYDSYARLVVSGVRRMMKRRCYSLVVGPVIRLSSEPGCRSLDENGECFVVACKVRNDLFMPYGLKLITMDGREDTLIPVHSRRPRCCKFSPFDSRLVLSTGEDKTLCVTSFGNNQAVLHRIELPTSGWSCCWLSENEVAVGLISGRVLKFSLLDPAVEPFDITGNNGHLPIISLHSSPSQSLLFVVSLKECLLYHHMQLHVLLSGKGAINSSCYDQESCSVMLTFAPGEHHETVTHVMYKIRLDDGHKELRYVGIYRSVSKKLTRMIRSAFWNSVYGPVAAVFDETNSQLVLYDWLRGRQEVVRRVNDCVVSIKVIATNDPQLFRLGCLSETALHLFEARC